MISAFPYIIIAHFMRDKLFRQTKSASGQRFSVFSHHTKVKGKTPGKTPHPASFVGHPLPKGEGWDFDFLPSHRGEGGPRPALLPAGAGRVRGLSTRPSLRSGLSCRPDNQVTPHPASYVGHPLPKGEGWLFDVYPLSARRPETSRRRLLPCNPIPPP